MKKAAIRIPWNQFLFCMIMTVTPAFLPGDGIAAETAWKAGVATVVITPREPVWMAGYGSRTEPSRGKVHDLHVKALALDDSRGNRAVIVTADLIGVTRDFSTRVASAVTEKHGIPRKNILFNTSHTHCGPEVRAFKIPFYVISGEYARKIGEYSSWLESRYLEVIDRAVGDMQPASISFASAEPRPFAVCRRVPSPEGILYRSNPSSYYTGGPRDDTVPVLTVEAPDGSIRAILFGYACHPITLNLQEFCGDYPGFAQQYIEDAYPGATALFMQGSSGQLVPNARHQIEYAMGHGRTLLDAVREAVDGERMPLNGPLRCGFEEVPLAFQPLPDRADLERRARSGNAAESRKAKFLLAKLDSGEAIPATLPCPLQALRFGDDLLLVGIGGETVVEYAVRFKTEFATHRFVWVAGYCNSMFGYLPTWRILREGGYEGGGAMLHTPYPGPFDETVEKRVVEGVRRVVAGVMDR